MSRLSAFVLAGMCAILATPCMAQDTHTLEYKFEKDRVDKYRVNFSANMQGMMAIQGRGQLNIVQTHKEVKEASGAIEQDVVRVKATMSLAGNESTYDTENPGDGAGMLPTAAKKLEGKTNIEVSKLGKVVNDDLSADAKESTLRNFIGAQFFPFDLVRLPEKAVKIGDSWSHTSVTETKNAMGQKQKNEIVFTYTLSKVKTRKGDNIATIQMKIEPKFKTLPGSLGGKITSSIGKGTLKFNITKGVVNSLEYNLKMEAENPMAQGEDDKTQSFLQKLKLRNES